MEEEKRQWKWNKYVWRKRWNDAGRKNEEIGNTEKKKGDDIERNKGREKNEENQ